MAKLTLATRFNRFEGPPRHRVLKQYAPGDEIEVTDEEVRRLGLAAFRTGPAIVNHPEDDLPPSPASAALMAGTGAGTGTDTPATPPDAPSIPEAGPTLTPTFVTLPAAGPADSPSDSPSDSTAEAEVDLPRPMKPVEPPNVKGKNRPR